MRDETPRNTATDLDRNIEECVTGREFASQPKDASDNRIEMCPRNGCKERDNNKKDRPCWQGIAQKGHGCVIAERIPHDARPDDRCDQQKRPHKFST